MADRAHHSVPALSAKESNVSFPATPVEVRLKRRLVADPETGCLNWTGPVVHNGYGQIGYQENKQKRLVRVHRLAYELAKGPIPEGMQIDHLCRNRRCCNPAHLEAVTPKVNTLRGNSPSAQHARKTHCPKGHPYNEANTRLSRGKRYCWLCRAERHPPNVWRRPETKSRWEAIMATLGMPNQ